MSSPASSPSAPPPTEPGTSSAPSQSGTTPSLYDALQTISPLNDLQRLPQIPCARYSLLFGIVAGTSVGALRFVFSRGGAAGGRWSEAGRAANWAVGAWGVGSLGAWETCRRRQTAEAARMAALVQEVKQRRQARTSAPSGSSSSLNEDGLDGKAAPRSAPRGPGGVLMGQIGAETMRERGRRQTQQPVGQEQSPPSAAESEPTQAKTGSGWKFWR